jgi:wyosine [tRNA(Phe)-imidazoG37] synthetase (radical SAM superfamily)
MEGDSLHKIQKLHNYVDSNILPNVESIALTGVGDPFMSQIFRKFLVDFNKNKYPNVKRIHLHTNGQLFNSKIYQKMKGLQDIELSVDISIDASTAETYSLVRPPGKWDRLLENLQFINSLPNIKLLGISMVVQQSNYREMLSFIEMGKYFVKRGREVYVEFKRPRQWNHLTDECFNSIEVDNDEFRDVVSLVELKRCMNTPVQVRHNLQEYL